MKYHKLLHTILSDLLIKDVVNIIHTYAIRYDVPVHISSDSMYHVNRQSWLDYKTHTQYKCDPYKIYLVEQNNSDTAIFSIDQTSSVDVLYNNICWWNHVFNNIYILDRESLHLIRTIRLNYKPINCVFLTEDSVMTLHDWTMGSVSISIYYGQNVSKYNVYKRIYSIGANHDNIFMLEVHRDHISNKYDANLLLYDHSVNYIKTFYVYTLSDNIIDIDMRVQNDIICITDNEITNVYKLNEL
jgi:hypothetical protein